MAQASPWEYHTRVAFSSIDLVMSTQRRELETDLAGPAQPDRVPDGTRAFNASKANGRGVDAPLRI